MAAKLENEYGVISIDREVIARIAGYAAIGRASCRERV